MAGPDPEVAARYQRVADALRAELAAGTYRVGDDLPSITALAATFGISHMTVKQALAVLKDEGLVASRKGVRTQVIATPAEPAPDLAGQVAELREQVKALAARMDRLEGHGHKPTARPDR